MTKMRIYQAALVILTMALACIAWRHGFGNPYAVVGLGAVAAIAERGRVRLGAVTEVSISLLPTVFAAAVFGPLAAMVVAICSLLGDFPLAVPSGDRAAAFARGAPYLKWGIYSCIRAIYGATAGFAAAAIGVSGQTSAAHLVVATAVAAIVAETLDVAFAALTLFLRDGDPLNFLKMFAPILVAAVSLYSPIVAILAVAYSQVSPWTLALFFLPALAAQRLFALYQEQRRLAEQLADANEDLARANLSF